MRPSGKRCKGDRSRALQSLTMEIQDRRPDLRSERRYGSGALAIDAPFKGVAVNCSVAGLCVETSEALPVGRAWPLEVRVGKKRVVLSGSIRWARLMHTEPVGDGEVRPVFKVGISLMEGRAIETWRRAVLRGSARLRPAEESSRRTIVVWKPSPDR